MLEASEKEKIVNLELLEMISNSRWKMMSATLDKEIMEEQ